MKGFQCATCGEWHDQLPLTFAADAPWSYFGVPEAERDERTILTSDQCVIDGEKFFIRGQLELPIHGSPEPFTWGVWVEVSNADFDRMGEVWETPGRESEPPYNVRLDTLLRIYPDTVGLSAKLITRPVGLRPLVQVASDSHPLAQEQNSGIPMERVRAIAAAVMHGST